jgi:hypothetical protein
VTAARQIAQAARFVSMADIEKGLQHIARKPLRPDTSLSTGTTANAGSTDTQKKQLQPLSYRMDQASLAQQDARIDTSKSLKLRNGTVRPLTPGGRWRDHSTTTTKTHPNTIPQALEGAALMSTSRITERATNDGMHAETTDRGGTGVLPTAAVLTQGGHVPGWLRYTTMMMRTMPLDQVRSTVVNSSSSWIHPHLQQLHLAVAQMLIQ